MKKLKWFYQDFLATIRFIWSKLTVNMDKFKRPGAKGWVFWFNIRHLISKWWNDLKVVKFVKSLIAYLRLYRAGFSITNSRSKTTTSFEINRFWWKERIIREMPDIDRIGENEYSTVIDGRTNKLNAPPKKWPESISDIRISLFEMNHFSEKNNLYKEYED